MIARREETSRGTQRAGEELAALLRGGDVVLLSGPLGAGKTTFVQGVARGLGVSERVTSPTFTLVRQHQCDNEVGIQTLHHADVYRVESVEEIVDLDLGALVEDAGVAIVEWGELAASVFGRDVLTISFSVADDESRTLALGGEIARARRNEFAVWAAS